MVGSKSLTVFQYPYLHHGRLQRVHLPVHMHGCVGGSQVPHQLLPAQRTPAAEIASVAAEHLVRPKVGVTAQRTEYITI